MTTDNHREILLQKKKELSATRLNREEIAINRVPDMIDDVQNTTEREFALGSIHRHWQTLRAIEQALQRLVGQLRGLRRMRKPNPSETPAGRALGGAVPELPGSERRRGGSRRKVVHRRIRNGISMTIKQCLCVPLTAGLLLTAACGERRTATDDSQTSAQAAQDKLRHEREEARRALDKRLDEIDKELDRMNESIAKASTKARRESRDALARLRDEAREARAKAAGLNDAASERWTDVKSDVQSALGKLEDGLNRAWNDIKN